MKTSAAVVFLVLLGLWLAWSGHYTPLLIAFGLLSCAGVVGLSLRMGIVDRELIPAHLTTGVLRYLPWLAIEVMRSNLDMIGRILGRKPVEPRMVDLPTRLEGNLAKATYANSITLTPGTLTVDIQDSTLTVHAIGEEPVEALNEGEMEARIAAVEGN